MGLGHFGGGVAAARWLAQRGARVTITDLADEDTLAESLALLADLPIAAFLLGGHREDAFCSADLVIVNPAVRPTSPWLHLVRQTSARLLTEIELFLENCPASVIGVTGSNGKSTTAAMIASILRADDRPTFLGGNIGGSLLDQLPHIGRDDWVVLELSSFQLFHFTPAARMPHVAVVTSCSPNHLDWHGRFPDYMAAKKRILMGQTPSDFAVLNTFDAEAASWAPLVRGRQIPLPDLDKLPPLTVLGAHNRLNAACAAAAATAVGCRSESIRRGLAQFRALPQRLEWCGTVEGRRFCNDSTATTPEATIAALRSLDAPFWLIAGGKSKGCDFGPLASEIVRRACGAALFGAVREELCPRLATEQPRFPCAAMETIDEAFDWCWRRSQPGDAIVLSPGCASTDQFRNFWQRGQRFVGLVDQLANPFNRQSRHA